MVVSPNDKVVIKGGEFGSGVIGTITLYNRVHNKLAKSRVSLASGVQLTFNIYAARGTRLQPHEEVIINDVISGVERMEGDFSLKMIEQAGGGRRTRRKYKRGKSKSKRRKSRKKSKTRRRRR